MARGFLSFALVFVLVTASLGTAGAPRDDTWREKADGALLEALDGGAGGTLRVLVQGAGIATPDPLPGDRAAWRAHWDAQSKPFLDAVRAKVEAWGGALTLEVAPIQGAFVQLHASRVPQLLAMPQVARAALDWDGATRIADEQGPGVAVDLVDTIAKVEAQDLWTAGYRGEGVVVAVLDTGIRATHEMMKFADGTTRVAKWKDTSGTCPASPCDGNGHGTHVATTAAGSNLFNTASPQGVAPRAIVWGVKVLSDGGSGNWEWGQAGLQWAFDQGADLTSNSWGGGCGGAASATAALAEALADAGMTSVFAAGNDGPGVSSVHCPGLADKVVTVGSVDINGNVAGSSGRGPCTWNGATRVCPDVMAVGVNVRAGWSTCDTCYATISGTSMSTPHVAGVVTLLQQASKALRGRGLEGPKEAEALLRHTAVDLGPAGIDNDYGWGHAKGKRALDTFATDLGLSLSAVSGRGASTVHGDRDAVLTFAVLNKGTVPVQGTFTHTVRQVSFGGCPPACEVTTVASRSVTLTQGQEAFSTYNFDGAVHAPGDYESEGVLAYTYTDPLDGLVKQGEVRRVESFLLKKVAWVATQVLPGAAKSGDLIEGGIVLANVGNANAANVRVLGDIPVTGVAPLPMVPPGEGPYGAFAVPGPNNVGPGPSQFRLRLTWNVGTVPAVDGAWDAAYRVAATQTGSHTFQVTVNYSDEGGTAPSLVLRHELVVGLPGP